MLERLESAKRSLGDKHPDVAVALENLGNVYYRSGRIEETIELLTEVAALRREVLGPNDPAVGRTLVNRGVVLWRGVGRLDEAEASMVEGIELMSGGEGANHPDVAHALATLASVRTARGDGVGAERALREALRIRSSVLGDEHRQTAESRIDLGLNLASREVRDAEARSLLSDGLEVLAPEAGDDDARVKAAREALAK
jgi:tetratricopeptide (TPR) repeat protein